MKGSTNLFGVIRPREPSLTRDGGKLKKYNPRCKESRRALAL